MRNSGLLGKYWDAVLASVLAAIALYLLMRHSGIGVSPDSVEYITSAESIRNFGRMADFTGLRLVLFPAGYPLLLTAILFFTGLKILVFAPVLNTLLFCGVLFASATILNGDQKANTWYRVLFLLALVLSRCLLQVYSMLWSETVFIFLTLLFIIRAHDYLKKKTFRSLLFFSLVTALTLVIRYAGVVLLAVGSILILADGMIARKKKVRHLLVFNLVSASLLAVNLVRNKMVSQSLTGVRQQAERTLWDNLLDIGDTFNDWFPFFNDHNKAATVFFILLVLVALAVVVFRILQQQFYPSYNTIAWIFFLVYALFIVAVATISRFEQLNSRLLLPLYIPLLFIGTSWLVPVWRNCKRLKKLALFGVLFLWYAGFHWHQYRQNAEAWEGIQDAGIPGYTEDGWTQSETIAYIRNHGREMGSLVYANANDAIYFLTGLRARVLPHKDIEKEINKFLGYPSFCVVLFTDGDNPDLVNLSLIESRKKLLWKKTFSDGSIYYFSN
jgi:hypothetical protein